MNISGIGGQFAAQGGSAVDASTFRNRMQQSMEPVAKALGTTTDALQQDLQSGKSLNDLASAKGVSQKDLLAAIEQGLQNNAPEGAPALSSTQLANLAARIASHQGRGGPGGVAGPPPGMNGSGGSGGIVGPRDSSGSEPVSAGSDQDILTQLLADLRSFDSTGSSKPGSQTSMSSTVWSSSSSTPSSSVSFDQKA